jgi:hypothetical protein
LVLVNAPHAAGSWPEEPKIPGLVRDKLGVLFQKDFAPRKFKRQFPLPIRTPSGATHLTPENKQFKRATRHK